MSCSTVNARLSRRSPLPEMRFLSRSTACSHLSISPCPLLVNFTRLVIDSTCWPLRKGPLLSVGRGYGRILALWCRPWHPPVDEGHWTCGIYPTQNSGRGALMTRIHSGTNRFVHGRRIWPLRPLASRWWVLHGVFVGRLEYPTYVFPRELFSSESCGVMVC